MQIPLRKRYRYLIPPEDFIDSFVQLADGVRSSLGIEYPNQKLEVQR